MKKALIFLFALYYTTGFSQEYSFTHHNVEDGLSSATIFEIFQSSQGFLWLGTENNGVCRFDGFSFEVFTTNEGMSGNTIRSIVEDKENRLWFATDNGITLYDGRNFKHITKEQGLSGNVVVRLLIDSDNNIWAGVAGEEGGLNKIRLTNDSVLIQTYLTKPDISKNAVFTIIEDSLNTIWAGVFGGGLYYSQKINDSLRFAEYPSSTFISNYILSSSKDNKGALLFGTYDKGVFVISPNQDPAMSEVSVIPPIFESNIKRVWDIRTEQNDIFIASNENGLVRIRKNNLQRIGERQGLPGNQLLKVFRDNNHNLWVSNYEKGISMFNSERIYRINEPNNDLRYNILSLKKQGDLLWLGTNDHGLIRYDLKKNTSVVFNSSNSYINDHVASVGIDPDDNLWLATNKGVYKIFSDKLIHITVADGLKNNEVKSILTDTMGNIWCGTKEGVSKISGNVISNSHRETGLISNEITTLFEDSDANVWVATYGGLAMFTPDGVLHNFDEAEGLTDKRIHVVSQDKKGHILVGTAGSGVFKGVKNNGSFQFQPMPESDLLGSKNVSFIKSIDQNLLVGTDNGITRIIYENNEISDIEYFNSKNGFLGGKCNFDAAILIGDTLFVGTNNGLFVIENVLSKPSPQRLSVYISNVKLFYKEVDWKSKGFSIKPWSKAPENLKLGFRDKNLTFEFKTVRFSNPEAVEYSSKIKEIDDLWPPYSNDNYKQYSNLQPGNYTLQVKARYGKTESEVYNYSFIITPPFYETFGFRLAALVALLIVFWLILRYRESHLMHEKIRLDNLVKERTREVVQQKNEIEKKNDKLQTAYSEISTQNKVIEEKSRQIIDSIQYAKNIQDALLPSEEVLKQVFRDYFILFKPRDIVSGDFYWFSVQDHFQIFVVADCTGHGVPGAFMSMLGISFLNEIVVDKKIFEPDLILGELRNSIITALKQQNESGHSRDGMDIALVVLDFESMTCRYSGANNDLLLVRNGNLQTIKADKMPIAFHPIMNSFTVKEISLQSNDTLYLFSDGFMDQIGGPNNKRIMKSNFRTLILETSHLMCSQQKEKMEEYFEEWSLLEEQLDDVLVVGIRV